MPPARSSTRRGRAAAQPRPRPQPAVPPLQPRANEVLVRMYGQGLGDCFLLASPRVGQQEGGRPVYAVIDCGVIGGTPDGPARMRQIVEDIRLTTLDPELSAQRGTPTGHIDVLAISHEHWDHVSGFVQAEEEWKQVQVDTIWTAWTEKPEPGLPEVLRKIVKKQQQALAQIADRVARFGLSEEHETVLGLMGFLSDAATEGLPFGARAVKGTGEAFDIAKGLAREKLFCEPGEVHRVPGTAIDAYVLGPPRSDARLRQMDPSKKTPETYDDVATDEAAKPPAGVGSTSAAGTSAGFAPPDPSISLRSMAESRSAFNAFALPLLGPALAAAPAGPGADDAIALSPDEEDLYDRSFPFDRSLRVPLPIAERESQAEVPTNAATILTAGSTTVMTTGLTAGATPDATPNGSTARLYPALASYYDEVNCWRRIDFDWLAGAEAFALQADSLTNNTCLVLAFELPALQEDGERKVLLFVGDAQVGNWLSWDEIPAWQPVGEATPSQRGATDITNLLARTAFYKVGHHGSHNATLKARGVERMRVGKPLIAFVPTSPPVARTIKDWCHMPLDVLMDALVTRTNHRVVLANGNVWPPIDDPAELAKALTELDCTVSTTMLPPKVRAKDQTVIEGEVPLWVQISIPY